MADVLSKVQQVKSVLPREAQDPIVVKQTGEPYALMYMSFNSKVMTASQITDYLTRVVQPRLQTIDGVANAQILGGQTFAMRIWLNPDKMAALGVTPLDVRNALAANNFITRRRPGEGRLRPDHDQRRDARSTVPSAFGKLVVLSRGDALIRLDDIATIELGPESADSSSVFDGLKAVFIGVFTDADRQPADRHRQRAQGRSRISSAAAGGHGGRHRLRRHQVHRGLDQGGADDAARGGGDRRSW